tara:strand:- start:104904 stop:105275 length:372 start_codon:yes stop_codon:yes gene_type:complete
MNKYVKYPFLICLFILIGSLGVHLFSEDFAGKLREEDYSEVLSKGEKLYKKKACLSCHGKGGNNPQDNSYPLIGGQPKTYLKQQIIDIRDGSRSNGNTAIMSASIQTVSDEEAYLIAFYLSKQ